MTPRRSLITAYAKLRLTARGRLRRMQLKCGENKNERRQLLRPGRIGGLCCRCIVMTSRAIWRGGGTAVGSNIAHAQSQPQKASMSSSMARAPSASCNHGGDLRCGGGEAAILLACVCRAMSWLTRGSRRREDGGMRKIIGRYSAKSLKGMLIWGKFLCVAPILDLRR